MAKDSLPGSAGRKRQWFARRQVYLRSGQDSQYVELSPLLQVGVAFGFLLIACWLAAASYGTYTWFAGQHGQASLAAELERSALALSELERERDAALDEASRIPELEKALADAETLAAEAFRQEEASQVEEARALALELDQAHIQLEELQLRLSESKADHAALQAKYEAEMSATTDASQKTAEEAANLHAQLEQAFAEIEQLQEDRDTTASKLELATEEKSAKDDTIERNSVLLKAATAEIERLQETINRSKADSSEQSDGLEATITKLETELEKTVNERSNLTRQVAELEGDLEDALQAAAEAENAAETAAKAAAEARAAAEAEAELAARAAEEQAGPDTQTAIDAAVQAQSILAGLNEAELLARIDELESQNLAATDGGNSAVPEDVAALEERVALAEAELERLLLIGLRADGAVNAALIPTAEPPTREDQPDPAEIERLRTELVTTQADNIKLQADVQAAKQRLAEQASAQQNGQTAKPDNSAKLEQQLASTRTRVQQLNKALADAKLREVAIDLALISVVPAPSPPAPR